MFFLLIFIAVVNCVDLSKEEIYGLTRDGLSRGDPDELLKGFFPVWPFILLALSGKILTIFFSFVLTIIFKLLYSKLFCNECISFLWLCYWMLQKSK